MNSASPPNAVPMASRIRDHDWSVTALGPIEHWPQSLRTAVDLMLCAAQPCYIGWGPETASLYNDPYIPILGSKHPDALGQPFREVFAEAWDTLGPLFEATMSGQAQHYADLPVALQGRPGRPTSWFTFSWTPLRDDSGAIAGFYCAATETTDRIQTERALRESEQRFRLFSEAASSVLWIRRAGDLALEFVSPGAAQVYGVPPQALSGGLGTWSTLVLEEDRPRVLAAIERVLRGERVTYEFRIRRPMDDAIRWIRATDFPILDPEGQVMRIAGIADDVTQSRMAVAYQQTLLAELQHRVRNTTALIRSITARTARGAASVPEFEQALQGRLAALGRVQTLITRNVGQRVDLSALVREELEATAGPDARARVSGPDISLDSRSAEVLSLALHELATNAVRHGAFSQLDGHLEVSWALVATSAGDRVRLQWREQGVPIGKGHTIERGFGSELIEARVPYELQGSATLVRTEQGVHCTLEFPLEGSMAGTVAPIE